MAFNSVAHPITKELMDAGIIPPGCLEFSFCLKPGLLIASYKVIVTEEQFRKIADVMIERGPEAARKEADLVVFSMERKRADSGDPGIALPAVRE